MPGHVNLAHWTLPMSYDLAVEETLMCMQLTQVRPFQKWHWAGDDLVHDTVIPASRSVAGHRNKWYPIDIREYLSIEDNAVVGKKLREIFDGLGPEEHAKVSSTSPGSFDLRADKVVDYVSHLQYEPVGRHFDQWLFPDETLHMQSGDCEDLAFVLAALLEASGISPYCIRVALGSVTYHRQNENPLRSDHAWVVYLNEAGVWEILEPLALAGDKHKLAPKAEVPHALSEFEYLPYFVFNRDHLWRVRGPHNLAALAFSDYLHKREFWEGFQPRFAVKVHEGIYDEALAGIASADLKAIKRASLIADVNVLSYDPRDHFDFAYIKEGWERVDHRLGTGDLTDFAYAIHAIADFYAHSAYADFALRDDSGGLLPYNPAAPQFANSPSYDFAPYHFFPGCSESLSQAALQWKGSIISGQWWRWFTTFPDELKNSPDFANHRCLPDHDWFAVDGPNPRADQRHYTPSEYPQQFLRRRSAAVAHIRKTYQSWHKV